MEKIKFQVEQLGYQEQAVNSVIDLLSGVDRQSVSSIYSTARKQGTFFNARPEANVRFSSTSRLLNNLQGIQYRNGLFKDSSIVGKIPQFTIEMETGTGKTFVYLETILRLWSEFGGQFKKFIIVVPSNPILLGVKKSIETFADYFKPRFNNIDLTQHFFVFDKNVTPETVTSKLIESTDLSIMIITNHSFNKESNRLRKESESGVVIWDDIKDIAPIVIIDEPQKMDGNGKKKSASLAAVEELNPPMILRYSATHKNLYNPLFKLDSYDAYKRELVKGIKVTTIHSLTPKSYPYVRYVKFDTKSLRVVIEIFHKEQGKNNNEVDHNVAVKKQMEIAIKAHIQKQAEILQSGKKIKVLTLFFVDSVGKVRSNDGDGRGVYLKMFDRVFERIRSEANLIEQSVLNQYPREFSILNPDTLVESIREGYFAVDKKHKVVDVEGGTAQPN